MANSRYKDFYDIYILAVRYDLDGSELKNAVASTFSHRGTGFGDIAAFEPGFTEDITRQSRWNAFIKKKKVLIQVSFGDTIAFVKSLLMPIVEAIENNAVFNLKWDKKSGKWN